uniref:Uncharacterized protein n=1 Tax=Rhizophora mucronata TaxID=61149 RepID=A0A2P2PCF8_RHIMU
MHLNFRWSSVLLAHDYESNDSIYWEAVILSILVFILVLASLQICILYRGFDINLSTGYGPWQHAMGLSFNPEPPYVFSYPSLFCIISKVS